MEPAKRISDRWNHTSSRRLRRPAGNASILSQLTRLIVSAAGVLLLFYCAHSVVLPVLLAWVGSMALKPPVTWLREHHFPASLAAALVLILLATVLGIGLMHFGRPVAEWVKSAPETLPRLQEKYRRLFGPVSRLTTAV